MAEHLRPGTQQVRIIATATGKSYSGKERLTLTVEDPEGAVDGCHLYLSSPGAMGRTKAVLKKLGCEEEAENWDFAAIDHRLVGQDVTVVVVEKSVDGGKPFIQVEIPLEESIVYDEAGQNDLSSRLKRMEAEAPKERAARGRNKAAKPVITGGMPKPAAEEAPPTDDDSSVPF